MISRLAFTFRVYSLLAKPGIIFGNAITTAGGIALALTGPVNFMQVLGILIGVSLVIGSACVFNNYIDRKMDEKMVRTRNRPFVKGDVAVIPALFFAGLIGMLGVLCLVLFGNLLSGAIASLGFFVYVVLYSSVKYHSVHATLVGSIAGAIPPVIGYVAVRGSIDLGALILFAMIALWQMPHFFAIAAYRLKEYAAASIPVLPLKRGMYATKIQMILYIMALSPGSLMLFFCGYTGYIYLVVASLLGGTWLWTAIQGFSCRNDTVWARKMFLVSLIVVMGLCGAIPF